MSIANPEANVTNILDWCHKAHEQHADIVVFPELCITGYSCGDMFRSVDLRNEALTQLFRIVEFTATHSQIVLVGLPLEIQNVLYNVAAVVHNGAVVTFVPKTQIPHKQEFYESRWFASAHELRATEVTLPHIGVVPVAQRWKGALAGVPGAVLGVELCEDLWGLQPQSSSLAWDGVTIVANLRQAMS